ncbi:MAG: hypothetical protein ABI824_04920 [Acidobacteriota bacterium]
MFARLLAFACLLSSSAMIGRAGSMSVPVATVGVYLKVDASASNLSLESMRLELRDLMAETGFNLVWTRDTSSPRVDTLIVVDLRGSCRAGANKTSNLENHSGLASTNVTEGKILPFSWVDCAALDHLLRPALVHQSLDQRDETYGRAMGRLLAHEFYHILAQTEQHTHSGITKKSFSQADLLANHLDFAPDAVARLQPVREPSMPLVAAVSDAEEAEESVDLADAPAISKPVPGFVR